MDEAKYHFERAKIKLESSKTLYYDEKYDDYVTMSYFTMFLSAKALKRI